MKKGKWIVKFVLAAAVFLLAVGTVTYFLWNWLIPSLFDVREITFVEALGLLLLAKILFGGWGRGRWRTGGTRSWGHAYYERLSQMSPEDRERFKSRMREKWRCGPSRQESKGDEGIANG